MKEVLDLVLSLIAARTSGMPSGELYALLMSRGCTLEVYNAIIGALKETGKITESNYLLKVKE